MTKKLSLEVWYGEKRIGTIQMPTTRSLLPRFNKVEEVIECCKTTIKVFAEFDVPNGALTVKGVAL